MGVTKGELEIINKNLEDIKEKVNPLIIGIDASLNNTGIIILNHTGKFINKYSIIPKTFGVRRLIYNFYKLETIINRNNNTNIIAVKEGYAYGRVQQAHQMGEWGGLIKFLLYKYYIPLIEVAPQSLKKFAGSSGHDKGNTIIKEVYKRWDFDTNDDNLADAFVLAMIGVKLRKYLKGIKTKINIKQREVIEKIANPIMKKRRKRENHL